MPSQFKSLEELNAEFLRKKQEKAAEEAAAKETPAVAELEDVLKAVSSAEDKKSDAPAPVPKTAEPPEKEPETFEAESPKEEEPGRREKRGKFFAPDDGEPEKPKRPVHITTISDEAAEVPEAVPEMEEAVVDKEPSKGTKRVVKIITNLVFYLVIISVLAGSIIFASSSSPDKSVFGYRFYNVLTPSMSPVYDPGDLIIVKLTNAEDVQVDDVITFTPGKDGTSYLTHRVIEKIEDYDGSGRPAFRTQGDANESPDSFVVRAEQVIGVVQTGIPFLGSMVNFVSDNLILVIIIIVLAVILCLFLRALFQVNSGDEGKPDSEESEPERGNTPGRRKRLFR